jgi:hypothetical protein
MARSPSARGHRADRVRFAELLTTVTVRVRN